jgi:LysM repeat protein
MNDDPELKMDDNWSDDTTYSSRRRRFDPGNRKPFRIVVMILFIFIFVVGVIYFISRLGSDKEASPLQSKVTALEQKVFALERQLAELQGKISTPGTDPAVIQQLEVLNQKVEALEKQKQPTTETKVKPSAPSKAAVSSEKQYHTVQKGETLYRISKKYKISVEELRKLNNLSADQPIRTGQKLLVSPAR